MHVVCYGLSELPAPIYSPDFRLQAAILIFLFPALMSDRAGTRLVVLTDLEYMDGYCRWNFVASMYVICDERFFRTAGSTFWLMAAIFKFSFTKKDVGQQVQT